MESEDYEFYKGLDFLSENKVNTAFPIYLLYISF